MNEFLGGEGVPTWELRDRLWKSLEYGNVTKAEMSEYLGVSLNTIGNYLSGRTHIGKGFLILWAQRTGVSLDWLERGELPRPHRATRERRRREHIDTGRRGPALARLAFPCP